MGKTSIIHFAKRKYSLGVAHTRRLLKTISAQKNDRQVFDESRKVSKTHYLDLVMDRIIAAKTKNGLIVEGIFSIEEAKKIANMFPKDLTEIVYVKANVAVRLKRLAKRHKISEEKAIKRLKQSDGFREKEGINIFTKHSDVVITNNEGLNELFSELDARLLASIRRKITRTLSQQLKKRKKVKRRNILK